VTAALLYASPPKKQITNLVIQPADGYKPASYLTPFSQQKKIWLGQPMSQRPGHAGHMKIPKSVSFLRSRFDFFNGAGRKLIAAFGTARLVRNQNGRHELIGGTVDDHAAARECVHCLRPKWFLLAHPYTI
jgi:hypothetical protein